MKRQEIESMGIVLKYNSSKARQFASNWRNSRGLSFFDCYKKPSTAKNQVYFNLRELQKNCSGYADKIVNHTCQFFTYAFLMEDENNCHWLYYNTGKNIYIIPMDASCSKKLEEVFSGMTASEIKNTIKSLAGSQGFYGRLLRSIEESGREEEIYKELEKQHFKDSVDMVLFFES